MGFSGWPAEAVEFFNGLRAGNTKACWRAHKEAYEVSVRQPTAELPGELSGEFGPGRIARPYRDVWFRAGKSPYKTEIYATFDRGGYVNFSADGLMAAAGYFMMSAAQLERVPAMPSAATPRAPGWLMWWSGSGPKASRPVAARLSRALRAGIPRTTPGSNCSISRA
jgi:hypothetical protein